ncbi:MAG: hypothetical protein IKT34_01350 [Clostridia bacterium]|nr:hypothetical protein [Clostridia bacterium]
MNNSFGITFTLDNRLCAVSAFMRDGIVYATDGITNCLYIVNSCSCIEQQPLFRCYRALRFNEDMQILTALAGRNRISLLSGDFCEYASLSLPDNCECLTDASVCSIGGTDYILAAFTHSAALFDMSGREVFEICETDCDESIQGFICFGENRYAMASSQNGRQLLTVSDRENRQSAVIDKGLILRSIFEYNGVIYGLFGRNYIYNSVYPIYSCGNLRLPTIEKSFGSC